MGTWSNGANLTKDENFFPEDDRQSRTYPSPASETNSVVFGFIPLSRKRDLPYLRGALLWS